MKNAVPNRQITASLIVVIFLSTVCLPLLLPMEPVQASSSDRGITLQVHIRENETWVENTTQPVGTTLHIRFELTGAIGLALTVTAVLPEALFYMGEADPLPADTSSNDLNGTNLYWTYDTGGNSRTFGFNVTIIKPGEHTLTGSAVLLLPIKFHQDSVTINGTPIPDTQPPSQVQNLTVTDAHNGKLNLKWDPATDNVAVSHYRIYRNTTFLLNHSTTTYQDTGLINNVTYTYQVSAVDHAGNEGNKSTPAHGTPTAGEENQPPRASFSHTTRWYTVSFTDTSTDPDGTIISWLWTFGDGTTSTTQHPTHTYSDKGPFTVSLTVTDEQGATDTVSQSVTRILNHQLFQPLYNLRQLLVSICSQIQEQHGLRNPLFSP